MIRILTGALTVPEVRKKLGITLFLLALYRIGAQIPVPGVSKEGLASIQDSFQGGALQLLNVFSGGALSQIALFALGIMPYITASIVMQLLQVVVPSLEKLKQEGEIGQQRITQYTRYLTVALAGGQSIGYVLLFRTLRDRRHAARRELQRRQRLHDRGRPDRRCGARHVDGRADHAARRRQRHVADDLRVDRVGPAQRASAPGGTAAIRSSRSCCRSSSSPSSRPWCSSRRGSGGSRSSTPSA